MIFRRLPENRMKARMIFQKRHFIALNIVLTCILLFCMLYSFIGSWPDGFQAMGQKILLPLGLFPFSYLMIALPRKCNVPVLLLRWFLRLSFIVLPLFSLVLLFGGDMEQASVDLAILNGFILYANIHFDDWNGVPDRHGN